jgi:putative flippase GtrA
MNSFITFGPDPDAFCADYAELRHLGVAGMCSSTAALFAISIYVPIWLAKLLSIFVSFDVNFSLSHFVVFRVRQSRDDAG